jgi:hypothetical protein
LTQRVRKAIKKKHSHVIDVEWLRQCKVQCCRVDHEEYLLTEFAQEAMDKRSNNNSKEKSSTDNIHRENNDLDEMILETDEGWTEPVSLGCCCVCHETDRDDCKWCVDCVITLARKAKLNKVSS